MPQKRYERRGSDFVEVKPRKQALLAVPDAGSVETLGKVLLADCKAMKKAQGFGAKWAISGNQIVSEWGEGESYRIKFWPTDPSESDLKQLGSFP